MRRPHFLPSSKASQSPQACIWVDTETLPIAELTAAIKSQPGTSKSIPTGREFHYLDYGWACFTRRRNSSEWTKPEWFRFTTSSEFWEWCISKSRPKTRLYLFAHNGAFDLPVLRAFSALPEHGFKITSAIVDAPPIDITWKRDNQAIRFVDTLNIWRMPLSALGDSVGLRKLKMPPESASDARKDAYCRRDVKVIMRACLAWFDFLTSNDLGGFRPTLASQSMSAYRHRFMPTEIGIHNNQRAIDLERSAYVGGRTECFRLGKYTGEFYYLDVNSMYPSVMVDNYYPARLQGEYSQVSPSALESWRDTKCVIVHCVIKTSEADYPLFHDNKLVFPIGRFTVSLCGPEFWDAYDRGIVQRVLRCAVYHRADLFTDYIRFMYAERLKAKHAGNQAQSFMYKIMMNSLYGKFGQRGRHYDMVGECDPDKVDIELSVQLETNQLTTRRYFGGIIQEWVDEGEAFHSFPGIAGYVTSYARMILVDAIRSAGRANCYYCDTDSLVVNAEGYTRLKHLIHPDNLGAWSLDRTLQSVQLNGAKDYIFDDVQRVKGVRKNAVWLSDNHIRQDRFVGFRGLVREGSLDAPIVHPIEKRLSRNYTKGIALADGRVQPLEINNGSRL